MASHHQPQMPPFGLMNQDTSYSAVSRSDDADIAEQGCHGNIEMDRISRISGVSELSQPHNSGYEVHNESMSPLTSADDSNTGYHPGPSEEKAASITTAKPGWEVLFADILAIGAPLGLLIFSIILWLKDQTDAEESTIKGFQNATQVLSTLFPVLYAAIVGRLMMQMARFKLEQGTTLGSLEQLLGSRTVGGAVLTPFHLRSFNLLALGLVLLWAFSPLGAQALLRFVEPKLTGVEEAAEAGYFDAKASPQFEEFATQGTWYQEEADQVMNIIDRIYSGVLLAPTSVKEDVMDLWGNVKVPFLTKSVEDRQDRWTEVSEISGRVTYSSLVGIPLANITRGNTTFKMESTYLEAVCDKPEFFGVVGHPDFPMDLNDTESRMAKRLISKNAYSGFGDHILGNGTYQGAGHDTNLPWSLAVDRLIDIRWANGSWIPNQCPRDMRITDGEDCTDLTAGGKNATLIDSLSIFDQEDRVEAGRTSLLFQAVITQGMVDVRQQYGTHCNITQKYVENQVECYNLDDQARETCRVVAQRPSRAPHPPEDISYLSFPRVMHTVSEFMPKSAGPDSSSMTSFDFTLQYLADPSVGNISAQGTLSFDSIEPSDFSERLSQVLNSYINIGQMYTDVTGNGNIRQSKTVPTSVTHALVIFQVDKMWAAFCVVSIFVLLGGGVAGAVLAHAAAGPEVLGFASTLIRDSRYVKVPDELAGQEGLEISERFRKIRMRFGVLTELGDGATTVGTSFEGNTSRIKDFLKQRKRTL